MSVNNINEQGMYIGSASGPATTTTIETVNESELIYAGQLGKKVKLADKRYQFVKVDSGATAAAGALPAASLLTFWKDKETFLVTTIANQSEGSYNAVAGVLTYAATPGNYTFIHKEGKRDVTTTGGQTAPSVGGSVIPYAGTGATANCVAAGGTAPIYKTLGFYTEAGSAGDTVEADLYIPD